MFYKVSRILSLVVFAALIIIPSAIVVMGSSKTDAEVYNKPLALPEIFSDDNFDSRKYVCICYLSNDYGHR
jgi:raffinose/stachyose/melibiose transport system permease protein